MIKKLYKNYSGIILILMMFFAWCFMTVSYSNGLFLIPFFLLLLGATSIFFHRGKEIISHAPGMTIITALAVIIASKGMIKEAFARTTGDKVIQMNVFGRVADRGEIFLGVGLFLLFIGMLITIYCNRDIYLDCIKKMPNVIKRHKWLLVLIAVVILLSYDSEWLQFKWDSLLYYQTVSTLHPTNIGEMGVYGHISQGFSLIAKIFVFLFQSTALGLYIGNIILLVTSVCYVYATLRLIIPDKSDFTYIALTAVYAFSPYYLGMVNYYSLDYYLICLFPIVVYYAFAEKWMQMTLTAIFFCFTKEPAIIIYGALCVGMVIRDVIIFLEEKKDEKMTVLSVLKKVFGTVHYYYMALPGLLWIFILVIIGLWVGGSHDVGVNADYIIGRVKALYVLNFSWIFVVIISVILASRIIIKKRSSSTMKITLPIICNLVAFTAFNFVFITVNQPRYVDSIAYSLYLLAAVLCGSICKEKVVKIVAPVIAILMLIQCFTTIDPLTRVSFDNINTGDGMVVSGMSRIGDASVYNKQMLWAEYPLRCAIKDALNDDSTIVYTAFCATTHSTDGMSEVAVVREDLWEETMYYDMEANRRLPDNSTKVEEISVYHASENARLNELGDVGTRISLIYTDIDSSQDVDMLTNQLDIESVGEYTYRGWVFHRVVGTVK